MSRSDKSQSATAAGGPEAGRSILDDGLRFDTLFIGFSVLLMVGLAWDFQVHAGGISFAEEPFWTMPHTIVYGSGAGIAALLGGAVLVRKRDGRAWLDAIPTGYALGLVGLLLFGAAGVGDFVWHEAISHEDTALEAVTSPTHLGLTIGGALFLSSPLRAAWRRRDQPTGLALLPALLSLSFVLSIAVVFVPYLNPLTATQILTDPDLGPIIGLASMVVFPVVLLATSLVLLRRFSLPPGALLVTFLIPGVVSVTAVQQFELLIPLVAAAVVADAFVAVSPPTLDRTRSLRLFGVVVPLTFAVSYFQVVSIWHGLKPVWSTHLWTGGVVVAGISGLLFTYALIPDVRQTTY